MWIPMSTVSDEVIDGDDSAVFYLCVTRFYSLAGSRQPNWKGLSPVSLKCGRSAMGLSGPGRRGQESSEQEGRSYRRTFIYKKGLRLK